VIEWEHSATTRAGNHYTNGGVHVVEFAPDGRIRHVRAYLDSAPILRLNQRERGAP
jgi:ketosteroid isomerase-like protein